MSAPSVASSTRAPSMRLILTVGMSEGYRSDPMANLRS